MYDGSLRPVGPQSGPPPWLPLLLLKAFPSRSATYEPTPSSTHRRAELLARATACRDRLAAARLDLGGAEAQIVPVVAGTAEAAVALSARLAEAGFFVPAIRPPSVPHGRSLIRASLSWLHPQSDLDQLADAIVACLR